jgi:small nuclear ribonucleoprotein (snRNP)-like protein
VVVELKSDIEITGTLVECDGDMNVLLNDAKQTLPDGTTTNLEFLSISGSSIRYVHTPPKVNIRQQVSDYIKKVDRIRNRNQPRNIVDRIKPTEVLEPKEDIILN